MTTSFVGSGAETDAAAAIDDDTPTARRRRAHEKAGLWIGVVLPLLVLGAWEVASHQGWVSKVFLPTPERTAASFFDLVIRDQFYDDLLESLSVVSQGFAIGALAGVLIGAAAGLSRVVERFLGPTLDGIRHIPSIAWLPLIVLWVGVGPLGKTIFIAKIVFFPVFLNTLQGIRGVPRDYVDLAKVLTLTRGQLLRRVIFPGALPSVLVGLRYGASLAWALVVVAESISGMRGIGFLIFRAQALLMTDQLLVCMVVIGLIGFAIDYAMRLIARHALRWKQGFEGR